MVFFSFPPPNLTHDNFWRGNLTDTHYCFLLHSHQLQKRGSVQWGQKNVCHSYFDIVEIYGLRRTGLRVVCVKTRTSEVRTSEGF